jgi:DHA1 family bicyclomycin/chloramphenicol resistance-like MFS transporter
VRLGWQSNFVVMAALAVLLFIAAWRGLPEHQSATGVQPHWLKAMLSSYAQLAREPSFGLHVLLLAMTSATFYAFLGGAPIVLGSYGVKPDGIGFYIMAIPGSYIVGNYLTMHLSHRISERRIMRLGQVLTVGGVALMLLLALAGLNTPLAFALPLVLLGIGHGLLVPPALAGTVGVIPALAGAAAAVAGLMQQLTGALAGYFVGLVPHQGPVNMAVMLLGWSLLGIAAQFVLHRWVQATGSDAVKANG